MPEQTADDQPEDTTGLREEAPYAERRDRVAGLIYEYWNPGMSWAQEPAEGRIAYEADADIAIRAADIVDHGRYAPPTHADIYREVAARLDLYIVMERARASGVTVRRWAEELPTDTQARRPLVRWYVERRQHDGWWPTSSPTWPRQRAIENLSERRAAEPDVEYRLARATTTYTVEPEPLVTAPNLSSAADVREGQEPAEARHDCNSGPGWYEVITPGDASTTVVLVYEDGSLYIPEGHTVLTPDEFELATAQGTAHRLVRADDPQQAQQAPADVTDACAEG